MSDTPLLVAPDNQHSGRTEENPVERFLASLAQVLPASPDQDKDTEQRLEQTIKTLRGRVQFLRRQHELDALHFSDERRRGEMAARVRARQEVEATAAERQIAERDIASLDAGRRWRPPLSDGDQD